MLGDHRSEEEMEAAEALAGLACFAVAGGSEGGGSGRIWRIEVEQEEERVEVSSSRSFPDLCEQRREMSGSNASKHHTEMDNAAFHHQKCVIASEDISEVSVKSEQDSILHGDRNRMGGKSYLPLGGRRLRHNLSEAEKEGKRIQRVLANRESARRTIRRRQAQCEDLTRRAAELTEENQRLKKGKELVLEEYKSLETTNKHLKAKMAEEIKPDLQIASAVLKPAVLDASASSSTIFPMMACNRPLGPVFWPLIIHSSTNENCQEGRPDTALAHEQEQLLNTAGTRSPVYIVPCPWFISLRNPGNECSSSTCDDRRNLNECCSSSGTNSRAENHAFDLFVEVKAEPPDPLIRDLNEAPVE